MKKQADDIKEIIEVAYTELPDGAEPSQVPVLADGPGGQSRESGLARLRRRLPNLPRITDPDQKRAGKNILRFLILVLVLTLVARGTAGATLPKVDTGNASRQEITEKVAGTATVSASGTATITPPEGLTLLELLADTGQTVAEGDPLARFDLDDVAEQLAREKAALDEMQLNLGKLERGEPYNSTALQNAQRSLTRAHEDYDAAVADLAAVDSNLEAARQAAEAAATRFSSAQAAEQKAKADYEAAVGTPDEEALKAAWDTAAAELAAAQSDAEEKGKTYQSLLAAYDQNKSQAEQKVLSAQRQVEDAQAAYDKAVADDAKSRQQAGDTAAQNAIDAEVLKLDIENQEGVVADLKALMDSEGILYADKAGIVSAMPAVNTETSAQSAFELVDGQTGYEATMLMDKKDAEKLSIGTICDVTTGGGTMYYQPTVSGTVTSISEPDANDRVAITIRLPDEDWTQGQSVDVEAIFNQNTYEMCVPLSALHSDSSGYFIYTLEQQSTVLGIENVVKRVPVTVKAADDANAAIDGPFGRNDVVITGSNKSISAGDRVRVNES